MVWHVVLLTPRPDLVEADRHRLVETFKQAMREIPVVREVRVGRRVLHGAAYEQRPSAPADFLVSIGFEDLAALQTYLQHPAHADLSARFYESLSSALVYDFESAELDAL
jgi:hypothetical protein